MTIRRPDSREAVFDLVDAERARQEIKHPGRTCAGDGDPFFKYTILGEEYGEVGRALLDKKPDDLILELTQVAAVAVSWLEYLTQEEL